MVAVVVLALPVILALAAIGFLLYLLYSAALYLAIWSTWLSRGRDVLVVYSNSPHWQAHFEQDLLPRLAGRAVVLNWSERERWRGSLAVRAFRHFGGDRAFNPLAVVFRPFRRARVFRFWQAYREAAHGHRVPLDALEREFFAALDVTREP
jgi:hypothetical protein